MDKHSEKVCVLQSVAGLLARDCIVSEIHNGYETRFTRHFYWIEPPPLLEAIDADLRRLRGKVGDLLQETAT